MGDGEQGLKDHAKQRIEGERPEGEQLFKMRLWAVQACITNVHTS